MAEPAAPPESPSPTPDPPAAKTKARKSARRAAAPGSSPGSAEGSNPGGFFEDAGPAVSPDDEQPAPLPEPEPDGPVLEWEEETVKGLLRTQGIALHSAIGVVEDGPSKDWEHTDADLRAIAPPLTRILNRYDATRAAAAVGDELALVVAVGTYTVRSYGQRRAELARQAEEPDQRVGGMPAPDPVPASSPVTFDADLAGGTPADLRRPGR